MAEVGQAFYGTFAAVLGGRIAAIANEAANANLHGARAAIAKHILQDWDGSVRQLLSVYTNNFQGAAEDAATVGANLDIVLDVYARLGVWS